MKTKHLAFILTAALAAHTYGGDAKVTLDSANGSSAFIVRNSASNELARVQSDGKVGIGTTTPASKFQVYGTETGANWAGRGVFGGASNSVVLGQYNNKAYFGAHNGTLDGWSDLTINPGGGNVLLANGGGNVGIGTDTPDYKLDVAGSINGTAMTIGGVPVATSHDTYWSTAGGGAIQYSGGNVGIGTATPAYPLDVLGDINLSGSLRLNGTASLTAAKAANWDAAFGWGNHTLAGYLTSYTETDPVFAASVAAGITADSTNAWNAKLGGSGTANYVPKFTASGTVGDSALFSDANGNVGIGTTTPVSKLHIAGADMNNALLLENTSANPGRNYILFKTLGTEQGYIGLGGGATDHMSIAAYGASNNLFLETGGLKRMTVLPSGNVGIGTTTPYTTLTVGSTDATAKITAGGPNTHLTLASAGPAGSIYLNAGGVESGNYSTSTRLTILPEGRVGIGTTTPADLLQVGNLMFGGNSGREIYSTSGYDINYKATGASSHHFYVNGTEKFTIDKTGNIGIGINTPDYTLHVNGSVAGTSAYNNLSDARLKKDVLPINDALAIVGQLRGVTFNWDKTVDPTMTLDDRNHVGFIAQEVEAVLPQAVSTATDSRQTKSVAYSEVIPVLTEAIKQLKAENDALKARLDALEAK